MRPVGASDIRDIGTGSVTRNLLMVTALTDPIGRSCTEEIDADALHGPLVTEEKTQELSHTSPP